MLPALGEPEAEVVFGAKTRWTYPGMTVVFEKGKVVVRKKGFDELNAYALAEIGHHHRGIEAVQVAEQEAELLLERRADRLANVDSTL